MAGPHLPLHLHASHHRNTLAWTERTVPHALPSLSPSLNASALSPAAPSAASLSNLINSPQGDPLPPAAGPGTELPGDDTQGQGDPARSRGTPSSQLVALHDGTMAPWGTGPSCRAPSTPCPTVCPQPCPQVPAVPAQYSGWRSAFVHSHHAPAPLSALRKPFPC